MRRSLAIGAALAVLGWSIGRSAVPRVVVTEVDTVPPAEMVRQLEDLRLEREGWRAALEAIEARGPETITRTDTLILPPDTVYRFVRVDGAGRLSVAVLGRVGPLYAPEIHRGIDVADCDDGYALQDGAVVCDRARFGHLTVGPGVEIAGELLPYVGAWWEPSYRSGWSVFVGYGKGWRLEVRKGVRIF